MTHAFGGGVALALATAFMSLETQPLPVTAAQCDAPGFTVSQGSPFRVDPMPGVAGQPRALARGTFFGRPGLTTACDCDLAVTVTTGDLSQPDFLVLLQGNEDGTFVRRPEVPALALEEGASFMVAGRFNNAVALDSVVVVTNRTTGAGTVTIFNANALSGRYETPTGRASWDTGAEPGAVGAGDVNGDERLDIVIANRGDRSISVLLGTGSGSFADPIVVTDLPGVPESIAIVKPSDSGTGEIAVALTSEGLASSPATAVAIVRGSRTATPKFTVDTAIEVGPRGSARPLVAAANLSAPASGTNPGIFRDLVVAFVDAGSRASTVLLLGRNGGGFDRRDGPALGATQPRSLAVADFDDDGAPDLAVAIGTSADRGEVRFFQGRTAPAPDLGFQANPAWPAVPASARPGSLVAGRFGPRQSGGAAPGQLGVAVLTLRPDDMVSVHAGRRRGPFIDPTFVTTRLDADARLIVRGDFHSATGDAHEPTSAPASNTPRLLHDVAYVSTDLQARRRLSVLLSDGAGGFSAPGGDSAVRAGAVPSLMIAGQFTSPANKSPIDLAVIDAPGDGFPILRIFEGKGAGLFTPLPFQLRLAHQTATAIVAGTFRGSGMPLDLGILSGNRMTVYFNDGRGQFSAGASDGGNTLLPFAASTAVVSTRLRQAGTPDLVIRGDNTNQIALLVSTGDGRFLHGLDRSGVFAGAGNVEEVLLGDVTGDGFDDAVTFDEDLTLRVFVNSARDGGEGFRSVPTVSAPLRDRAARRAGRGYVLADFAGGPHRLAATIVAKATPAHEILVTLKANSDGLFVADETVAALTVPAFAGTTAKEIFKTRFELNPTVATPEGIEGHRIVASLPGVFRGGGPPGGKADLAIMTMVSTTALTPGACLKDPTDPPPFKPVCRKILERADPIRGLKAGVPDPDTPCCGCVSGPKEGHCPGECTNPGPRIPACKTTREYSLLTVYGNTCDPR